MSEKMKFQKEILKRKSKLQSAGEVAEELTRLAEELGRGGITISGEKLTMGDTFSFSIKKQLKKGVVSCEIFLQSRLTTDEEIPAGDVDDVSAAKKASQGKKVGVSGGKKLKKDIARLWKEVTKLAAEETALSPESAQELTKKCEDYNLCADKEWFDSWRQCSAEIKGCLTAVKKGDFATAREKVALVNRLTKECHRIYK
ncbi:MAG: hypothetical protein V1706_10505 [Pseudomonadota bacterium]